MEILLKVGGLLHLLVVVYHSAFPKLFNWSNDLSSVDEINRRLMPILNICLSFLLLGIGILSLLNANELLGTALGVKLLTFVSIFWVLRAGLQVIYTNKLNSKSWAIIVLSLICAGIYATPILQSA